MLTRSIDIILSACAIVVLSPLMVITAAVVGATSPGGVLFRGVRVGRRGRDFKIMKFRTMVADAEGRGKWNVGMNDPRLTRVGKFLRATKLDELPQFFNVICGDMSLVGPRPELRYYTDMYSGDEKDILRVRPGVTDWASLVNYSQYKGFTEAADPDAHYLHNVRPLKVHLQLYEIKNRSVTNYLRILVWTARNLVSSETVLPPDILRVVRQFEGSGWHE